MLVVGIGGTSRPGSTSEIALRVTMQGLADSGAEVRVFSAGDLRFPLYDPADREAVALTRPFLDTVRAADGIVLASPGYHGTVSGLIKNACDYLEELSGDERPYLSDRPVGCVSVAYGWQAAVNTLRTLRDIAHALRGWPTPYGAAINAANGVFANGRCVDTAVRESLLLIGRQVMDGANRQADLQPVASRT